MKDFFEGNQSPLKLKLLGSDAGFGRKIWEPSVNRPGLALSGFFTYFAYKRIQVIGNSEISFLLQLLTQQKVGFLLQQVFSQRKLHRAIAGKTIKLVYFSKLLHHAGRCNAIAYFPAGAMVGFAK